MQIEILALRHQLAVILRQNLILNDSVEFLASGLTLLA
jgi:hypothetical protein